MQIVQRTKTELRQQSTTSRYKEKGEKITNPNVSKLKCYRQQMNKCRNGDKNRKRKRREKKKK